MLGPLSRLMLCCVVWITMAVPVTLAQGPAATGKPRAKEDPQVRARSLGRIAEHLQIDQGSVIADIGAGAGRDTWVFAQIVGSEGKVYSVEIASKRVESLKAEVQRRELSQIQPILSKPDDPCLPPDSVDMAFMHHVYHHVTEPQAMLQGIWRGLKPGGYLVVVDQRLGTLVDWVPREQRGPKHFWIAETTVVREARENGFRFVEYAEPLWHVREAFVLVFQRPEDLQAPDRDPDPLPPIAADTLRQLLPETGQTYRRVAFVALGPGRELIGPYLAANPCQAIDIVLEEWATQRDERPALPPGVELPSVLTDRGDPQLGSEPLDAVYFLDTYHLLFHGPTLLSRLRQRLTDTGRVYILDRQAPSVIPHREASHRRMIAAEKVQQQMQEAGFTLVREGMKPAENRFLLVFKKSE